VLSLDEGQWGNGQDARSGGTVSKTGSNSALGWARINALMNMDVREVYEITTRSGRKIRTTAEHPYLKLG